MPGAESLCTFVVLFCSASVRCCFCSFRSVLVLCFALPLSFSLSLSSWIVCASALTECHALLLLCPLRSAALLSLRYAKLLLFVAASSLRLFCSDLCSVLLCSASSVLHYLFVLRRARVFSARCNAHRFFLPFFGWLYSCVLT